jgi:outer membrane immunogenic protein
MKKLLVAAAVSLGAVTVAQAADFPATPMPAKVALPAPVIFNWTGCYVGAEGGGNWGRGEQVAQSGPFQGTTMTAHYNLKGGLAGGTVGCQMQNSNFVFGIEDDYSWTNKKGTKNELAPFDGTAIDGVKERWIDTLRGRFGYVPIDTVMLYLTGGAAFAGIQATLTSPAIGTVLTDSSQTRIGWTAGAGIEWAAWVDVWGAMTVKFEYLHADFGSKRYFNPPSAFNGVTIVSRDVKVSDDMARVGVNWKFNWGSPSPVVARY